MGLSFILGDATKDHQNEVVKQIAKLKKREKVKKIYILVPNHIKFASEISILQHLRATFGQEGQVFAQSSVQVLSFSRLAWFFLKDNALYQRTRISNAGLNMLVLSILEEKKDNLTIFKGEQAQSGFVSEVVAQLDEFSKGQINSQDLAFFAEQTNAQSDLYAKLKDLQIIYQEYENRLIGKYLDSNQLLKALTKKLIEINLKDSCFIITGFSQLTASENKLVETLIKNAGEVDVDLILDKPQQQSNLRKNSLYYRSNKLYDNLSSFAGQNRITIQNIGITAERVKSPILLDLGKYWTGTKEKTAELKSESIRTGLDIFSANNRYLEIEEVATRIRHCVIEQGYHYSDFIILTRHLDLYRNIIAPVFGQYQLPFFIDLQKKMTDHPFVEFIMALFAVKKHYYRYDDVMRLLKTELLLPEIKGKRLATKKYREYLDLTENLVLKFGFEGKSWLREDDWVYYRFYEEDMGTQTDKEVEVSRKVNIIRRLIKTTLPPFFEKINRAKNGKEAAQILCNFLIETGISNELLKWRDSAIEEGKIEDAAKPEETWNAFCELLDEYVELLGNHKFDEEQFVEILQTGFQGAEYSQVPSTLDQIIVSESGMVQMNDRKITFLIGATDAVMPDKINNRNIISDEDRSYLKPALNVEQYLNDDTLNQLAAEPFLSYLAFMSPSDKLYLSYPLSDDGKENLRPSPYVTRIANHYGINVATQIREPQMIDSTEHVLKHYLGTKKTTIKKLLTILRQAKNQRENVPTVWIEIHNFLKADGSETAFMNKILGSLSYQNIPEKLEPKIVDLLYGKTINTSISKLEEFYANEYAYFLKYGLKLQERSIFELSAANTGEFFHLAMDSLVKMLENENTRLSELTVEKLMEKIRVITAQIRELPQFQILNSTQRMQFLARQLDATVMQIAKVLQKQQERSSTQIIQTEALFGHVGTKNGIAPLEFKLGNGYKVNVRGKIDRIDQISAGDTNYIGIVDYKSSSHVFDFRDAYYGLALQMLTYLDALMLNFDRLTKTKPAKPAGALYMHLYNPKLKAKDVLKQSKEDVWLKANKYDGLIISDEDLLQAMDEKLAEESSGFSKLYPFRKNKDGSFKASGRHQLVTLEELKLLLQHNEYLIKEAANRILSGDLSLNPVQWPNKRTALQFSPYKSIFQFDAMLPENNYRKLPKISPEEVIRILTEGVGEINDKI